MSDFLDSVRQFCDAFAASEDSSGVARFVENGTVVNVSGRIVLSGQLLTLYQHVELVEATVGGVLFLELFSPAQLDRLQEGWRWTGPDGRENPQWKAQWIVFGDRNGDALVADTFEPSCRVFGSVQQRNFAIADSMEMFLRALTMAMIVESNEFEFDTREEDMSIKQEFINAVMKNVQPMLGAEAAAGFHKYFFG